jgi:hypothetical protein
MKGVTARINYDKTKELREIIWQKNYKERTMIQRTDLVHCLLKVFCRDMGVKPKPAARSVEAWIVGDMGHLIIEGPFERKEEEIWGPDELSDIPAHIDFMWGDDNAEIKTTVHNVYLPSHIEGYMEDIVSGFLFNRKTKGVLVTLNLIDKMLLVWDIKITKEAAAELLAKLNSRKELIRQAVKSKSFDMLEPKTEECPYCSYNYITDEEVGCPYSSIRLK